jgi:hypothetical protein
VQGPRGGNLYIDSEVHVRGDAPWQWDVHGAQMRFANGEIDMGKA